jgi:AhpD family alkylhydroperoxidase
MTDYVQLHAEALEGVDRLAGVVPEVIGAYMGLAKATLSDGALDARTKELIAMSIAVATQCDGCMVHHVKAAHDLGATRQQIAEAIGVVGEMRGGPGLLHGTRALDAFDQIVRAAVGHAA